MEVYHISRDGIPRPCKAETPQSCTAQKMAEFSDKHFDNHYEACRAVEAHEEKKFEEENKELLSGFSRFSLDQDNAIQWRAFKTPAGQIVLLDGDRDKQSFNKMSYVTECTRYLSDKEIFGAVQLRSVNSEIESWRTNQADDGSITLSEPYNKQIVTDKMIGDRSDQGLVDSLDAIGFYDGSSYSLVQNEDEGVMVLDEGIRKKAADIVATWSLSHDYGTLKPPRRLLTNESQEVVDAYTEMVDSEWFGSTYGYEVEDTYFVKSGNAHKPTRAMHDRQRFVNDLYLNYEQDENSDNYWSEKKYYEIDNDTMSALEDAGAFDHMNYQYVDDLGGPNNVEFMLKNGAREQVALIIAKFKAKNDL